MDNIENVLFLTENISMGGISIFLSSLVKNIGYKNYVFGIENGAYPINFDYDKLIIYSPKYFKSQKINPLLFPWYLLKSIGVICKLNKIVRNNNIKIIHCQQLSVIFFAIIVKLLNFNKIKLVQHDHGFTWYISPKNEISTNTISKVVIKYLLKFADIFIDKYITTNNFGITVLNNYKISNEKILKLTNFYPKAINKNNFHSEDNPLKKLVNNQNSKIIGFLARLEKKQKAWDIYVDAAKILLQKYNNIEFFVGGDGPDKSELLDSIKEFPNIHFLGYVKDLHQFYSILDIFVIPSNYEACPLVFTDALSYNITTVVSDAIGLNENAVDGFNSLLFEPGNSKDLAAKIEILLNNRELAKEIKNNIPKTLEEFSFDNYFKKLNNLYYSLTDK